MKRLATYSLLLFLIAGLFLILLTGCAHNGSVDENVFGEYLENTFSKAEVISTTVIGTDDYYHPVRVIPVPDRDLFVISNITNRTLFVGNPAGEIVSEVGGRGQGPDEFEGFGRMHFGSDEVLYVNDPRLHRVSRYQLNPEDEQLIYKDSFSIKSEENYRLVDLFITEVGVFGLFNRMSNFENGQNHYSLFELDNNYQIKQKLLEIPGNEMLELSRYYFIDDPIGESRHWAMDGPWFYTLSSKNKKFERYNVTTGENESVQLISLPERKVNDCNREYLLDSMSALIESQPIVGNSIEQASELPVFSGFSVKNGIYHFEIFYTGCETPYHLVVDPMADRYQRVIVSPLFSRSMYSHSALIGIDYASDGNQVKIIQLSSSE